MSDLSAPRATFSFPLRRFRQRRPNLFNTMVGFSIYLVGAWLITRGHDPVQLRVDLTPLLTIPLPLKAHIIGAVSSFLIGAVLLMGVKGRTMHRVLGYTWVVTMAVTAGSSFLLTGGNGDHYSPIHLLSGWTVIVLPMAVAAARRRDIRNHAKGMTGMFVGGMLIAGLFSFLPGRFMWHLFFTV